MMNLELPWGSIDFIGCLLLGTSSAWRAPSARKDWTDLKGVCRGDDMTTRSPGATLIRIVQSYYDAVDSMDAYRISSLYLPAPSTTLQFNADPPIVTVEAIKAFSAQFTQAVAGMKHSMIEIWTNPLKGDVVPVDLPPLRSSSTVTVVSTALPTFSIRNASGVTSLALPAASIFTIDKQSEKFVSVHNLFDIAKVYAAVQWST
jgi:hypothetical protein